MGLYIMITIIGPGSQRHQTLLFVKAKSWPITLNASDDGHSSNESNSETFLCAERFDNNLRLYFKIIKTGLSHR